MQDSTNDAQAAGLLGSWITAAFDSRKQHRAAAGFRDFWNNTRDDDLAWPPLREDEPLRETLSGDDRLRQWINLASGLDAVRVELAANVPARQPPEDALRKFAFRLLNNILMRRSESSAEYAEECARRLWEGLREGVHEYEAGNLIRLRLPAGSHLEVGPHMSIRAAAADDWTDDRVRLLTDPDGLSLVSVRVKRPLGTWNEREDRTDAILVERALTALRLAVPVVHTVGSFFRVGHKGPLPRVVRSPGRFNYEVRGETPEPSADATQTIRRAGSSLSNLTTHADALSETPESRLELCLRNFSRVLGPGARSWEERVLDAATVLEALFAGGENTELTHKIAMRTALLLAAGPDESAALFEATKRLYGLRSAIVHAATDRVPKEARRLLTCVFEDGQPSADVSVAGIGAAAVAARIIATAIFVCLELRQSGRRSFEPEFAREIDALAFDPKRRKDLQRTAGVRPYALDPYVPLS